MRLRGVHERHFPIDAQLQRAVAHPAEHVAGAPGEFLACGDVVTKRRPREEDRTLLVEYIRVERGNWSAGLSEEREHAAQREAVHALEKGRGADGDVPYARANGDHRSRALGSRGEWKGILVQALSVIHLDEVHSDRFHVHERFAGAGRRIVDGLELHDLRPARFMNSDGSHAVSYTH